jgi:hypothetical protein
MAHCPTQLPGDLAREAGIGHVTCARGKQPPPAIPHTERMPGTSWAEPDSGWPPGLWQVPNRSSATPGTNAPSSWLQGSNCQRFAYGLLALFGLACPPLRSSELRDDRGATATVSQPHPLDLVLVNATSDPFGAHAGVWVAPDEIFHLCKEIGTPAVWPFAAFASRPRSTTLIGFKRVTSHDLPPSPHRTHTRGNGPPTA